MANPDRSATIWYAADGFDPKTKGLNGRRVAGESFLRGFLQHADVDVLQSISAGPQSASDFATVAEPFKRDRKVEGYHLYQTTGFENVSTIFYPSPTLAGEAWRRFHIGQDAFSICGITHTTATKAIMEGLFNNRCAPIEPWDGIICTSKSVYDHVQYQHDLFDEYAGSRFGTKKPTRPNTTIIPLGIHTKDFAHDAAKRGQLRKELNVSDDDVVFTVLSRLSAQEKFDPIPMYRALQLAQNDSKKQLHLILCGYFSDADAKRIFTEGAKNAMPKVRFRVVDGKNADRRISALSASDVFLFPIDNLQETFGLAPIEAMAAGLPVIVSDWDGMKDTVTPDVGFRIPTRFVDADLMRSTSFRYQTSVDSYNQYTTLNAAMTQIDVPEMARKMSLLAQDPELRAKMGQAAKRRAETIYDWSVVIPQTQDYWAELTKIRKSAQKVRPLQYGMATNPISPNSGDLFAGYPTQQGGLESETFFATNGSNEKAVANVLKTRGYEKVRRYPVGQQAIVNVLNFVVSKTGNVTLEDIITGTGMTESAVKRSVMFLLKYDLLRTV
ncbi:MAG: glycosyltransferase family 4 protein [Planktomarina sp.]